MLNHPYSELFDQFQKLNQKLEKIEILLEGKSEPKPEINETLYTVKTLAERWQCNPQTILKKKLKGELPFIQHGRKILFSKAAIDELTTVSLSKKGR
ncbi:helix-turn-helix domain-containing protein [Pedobacter cryotolerans]|uniref:Helix-turn-helix domain-containing protein n=1 Tax=Pedobacter cryotolerans TaxID=2571270 RepID=A0A4U1C736_9SPHI|nr:helix-turn-helix domain-containing protein [Pedobacter cryotolerans]TKC01244.1 helix-turn-helix domain-containing protein [Pedobacter cryotolerans]